MNAKSMQVISTRTHGILDYLTAGAALLVPRLLGCNRKFTDAMTMLAVGKLGYSMMTRHELGLVKLIPMKVHLAMDTIGGATMAALPLLTDEDDPTAAAFAVGMGIFDIAAAPLTQTHPVSDDDDATPDDTGRNEAYVARQMREGASMVAGL
jgi:hypothetical protein